MTHPPVLEIRINVLQTTRKFTIITTENSITQGDLTKVQGWSDIWMCMHIGESSQEFEYTMKLNDDVQKINTVMKINIWVNV